MNRRRVITLVAAAAVVVAALVWGFMPRPVPVDLAAAGRGPMVVTVDEEGKTRVKDRYVVSAPVNGYVRRIDLDVGDPVEAGAVIAVMEPRRAPVLDPRSRAEAEARVAAASSRLDAAREGLAAARADAELAEADLERTTRLFEGGYVPRDVLDAAEARARRTSAVLRSADFNVDVAAHELAAARVALKNFGAGFADGVVDVSSPVDGRVLKVFRESEGAAPEGEPLVEVGDPSALEVESDLLSEDSVRVRPGSRVLFTRWGGDETLEGAVRVVEPAGFTKISALGVEEQRVLVISDITSPVEVWQRLGDGYRVEASFVVWEGSDVLQVPASALFRYGDGWAVFVYEDGRAVRRAVEAGHTTGLATEILSGVSEGEMVITHPDDAIDDGVRVEPRGS